MTTAKLVPLAELTRTAQARVDVMSERRQKHGPQLAKMLNRLAAVGQPRAALNVLRDIADMLAEETTGQVPCKQGCAACCHMPVGVAADEAKVIAQEIGRTLAKYVPHRTNFNDDPFGDAYPCQFLEKGECSIYAHRPMACRTHYSVEDDPAICGFGDSGQEVHDVKLLNVHDINMLYVETMMMRDGCDRRLNSLDRWFPK